LDAVALDGTGVECVADPFVVSRSWQHFRPTESPEALAHRRAQLISEADLVIGTGGDLYTSDYGVSTPYLRALIAAQQQGVPTALLGQSVGPFDNPEDAEAWAAVGAKCQLLTMRESVTRRYVVDQLGLPTEQARLSSDPAFLLAQATADRTTAVLAQLGLTGGDAYVCVAPSQGITRFSALEEQEHVAALLRLVTGLVETRQVPVLLVPHCHDSRAHNDDRILAARIATESGIPQVMAVPGPLNAADYKGILARADLVIAERLHAAIGALSSGVPAVAIGHSQKFNGVLAETFGDSVPVDHVHLDVRTFARDASAIPRLIDGTDVPGLRRVLGNRLPLVVRRAQEDFVLLEKTARR
jgi:polysaccharide pyruvyl transferase WcaK-like protein